MPQGLRLHATDNIVHTIGEYIRRNQERANTTARLSQGQWQYLINGTWHDQDTFNALRPRVEYKPLNWKGEDIGKFAKL